MILQRQLDWRTDLIAWAEAVRGESYEWGRTDCGALARTAVRAMFGQDLVPFLAWGTEAEAARVLEEVGGIAGVLLGLGAVPCTRNFLNSGAIIVEPVNEDGFTPVLVYVEPVVVTSHPTTGVRWYTRDHLEESVTGYNLWEAKLADG